MRKSLLNRKARFDFKILKVLFSRVCFFNLRSNVHCLIGLSFMSIFCVFLEKFYLCFLFYDSAIFMTESFSFSCFYHDFAVSSLIYSFDVRSWSCNYLVVILDHQSSRYYNWAFQFQILCSHSQNRQMQFSKMFVTQGFPLAVRMPAARNQKGAGCSPVKH